METNDYFLNEIDISIVKKPRLRRMVDSIRSKHTEEKIVECLSHLVCDRSRVEYASYNKDHFEIEAMIVAEYLLKNDLVK